MSDTTNTTFSKCNTSSEVIDRLMAAMAVTKPEDLPALQAAAKARPAELNAQKPTNGGGGKMSVSIGASGTIVFHSATNRQHWSMYPSQLQDALKNGMAQPEFDAKIKAADATHLNLFQRGWKLFLENEEKPVVVEKREPGKAAVKVTVTLTRKAPGRQAGPQHQRQAGHRQRQGQRRDALLAPWQHDPLIDPTNPAGLRLCWVFLFLGRAAVSSGW